VLIPGLANIFLDNTCI